MDNTIGYASIAYETSSMGEMMDQKEYRPNHAMERYLLFVAKRDEDKREYVPIIPQYERQ